MSDEQAIGDDPAESGAAVPRDPAAYEPFEEDEEWLEDPAELPRRPRRRLLSPVPVVLLGGLLLACGFIGGVLVEKGEGSSNSSSGGAASLASRFSALRGRGLGAGAGGASSASASGGSSGAASGFSRPTSGEVTFLDGSTLYLTNAEGNTLKVTTSPSTSVTKSVKTGVNRIHPGETVSVIGETGSNGTIDAESISVGSSGGGLAALFSGSGAGGAGASGAGSTGSSSGGSSSGGSGSGAGGGGAGSTPQLFGNGG